MMIEGYPNIQCFGSGEHFQCSEEEGECPHFPECREQYTKDMIRFCFGPKEEDNGG